MNFDVDMSARRHQRESFLPQQQLKPIHLFVVDQLKKKTQQWKRSPDLKQHDWKKICYDLFHQTESPIHSMVNEIKQKIYQYFDLHQPPFLKELKNLIDRNPNRKSGLNLDAIIKYYANLCFYHQLLNIQT